MGNRARYALMTLVLGAGSFYAWLNVFAQGTTFLRYYPSFFYVKDCVVPNPILTPCLYGASAMLVALVWSLALALREAPARAKWLVRLLLFGAVFAAAVLLLETLGYYHVWSFGEAVSCSPGTPPWETPCFFGFLAFLVSALLGMRLKSNKLY